MKIKVDELRNFISEETTRIKNFDNHDESDILMGNLNAYKQILKKIESMVSDEFDELKKNNKKIIENAKGD